MALGRDPSFHEEIGCTLASFVSRCEYRSRNLDIAWGLSYSSAMTSLRIAQLDLVISRMIVYLSGERVYPLYNLNQPAHLLSLGDSVMKARSMSSMGKISDGNPASTLVHWVPSRLAEPRSFRPLISKRQ